MNQPAQPEQKFTTEYLQYQDQYNRTFLGEEMLRNELAHQKKMHELLAQEQVLTIQSRETSLQAQREAMRPYRLMQTFVCYDTTERKYRCQLPDFADFEDEAGPDEMPIVAYGDTPAQACANFDHLWVHGRT